MPETGMLENIRALILRPEQRGQKLVAEIIRQGGKAWQLSMLETRRVALTDSDRTRVLSLDQYHKIICISATAAAAMLDEVDQWWPQLPVGTEWYAIGPATAQKLQQENIQPILADGQSDSEALLALESMQQVDDQRILLVCGRGGRTLLQEELAARGARVERLELYERYCPDYESGVVTAHLTDHHINCMVATSSEMLANLLHYFNPEQSSELKLLVPGSRVAEAAETAGFHNIVIADGADDASMIRALQGL
ncbi:uroporphyrinogen-III synthase [Endozoicomonadaceae bacterium StTr2]